MATRRRRVRLGGIISATAQQVNTAVKAAADALKSVQQINAEALERERVAAAQAAADRAAAQKAIDDAAVALAAAQAEAEADRVRLEGELAKQMQSQGTKDQSQDQAIAAEAAARALAIATAKAEILALIPPRGVQVVAVGSAAVPTLPPGAAVDVTLTLSEAMPDTGYKVSILRPAALLTTGTEVTVKSQTTTTVVLTIKAGLALAIGNSVSVVVTR